VHMGVVPIEAGRLVQREGEAVLERGSRKMNTTATQRSGVYGYGLAGAGGMTNLSR
jgi:hypothetical protein